VVTAETLAESASVTFAQALQGKSAGVFVSTTGAPGSDSKIRVRGIGSVNGSDPLVIIDGVSGGTVSSVPSNDIESFQILKDASATAIYGAQGANGVIIVTTKQGTKTGQPRVSYNGYVGVSKMANDGFDVLNAWEMMEFAAEGMINLQNYNGVEPSADNQFGSLTNVSYDYSNIVGYADDQHTIPLYYINSGELTMPYAIKPAGYSEEQIIEEFGSIEAWEESYSANGTSSWSRSAYYQILDDMGVSESEATEAQLAEAKTGTDWYNTIVQNGFIQDHQLSVMGGNDKGQYSMSIGYTSQEGTVESSYYDRYSVRANATFNPRKHISVGQNTSLSVTEYQGDRGTQSDGSVFSQTYTIKSWVPVYNVGGDYAGSTATDGGRTTSAYATTQRQIGDINRGLNASESIFAEIKPIEGLTLKSQLSATLTGTWAQSFSEITVYDNKEGQAYNSYTESAGWGFGWQWTNTATYTKKIDDNNFTVIIGSEALDQGYGSNISGTRRDYSTPEDQNTWTLSNGGTTTVSNTGTMKSHYSIFGYFGRVDYSYKGKYLATVNVRRDASSKFSESNRWGTFPSMSLGWRISDESFMDGTSGWLDDLKIRGGYGMTGNSNIGEYNWAFQYSTGSSYLYAITGTDGSASTGFAVTSLGFSDAKWETVNMLNVGFDATALKNRMTIGFDYYNKYTSDMLVSANWSALAGSATKPNINIGDMKNTGVDFSIGWKDKIGDFSYGITGNISQYKNEVIKLGSSDLYTSTRISNMAITTPGQSIGMFYGYNILGIYQSADDVLNYVDENGETVLPYSLTNITSLVTYETDVDGTYLTDANGDYIRTYENADEDPLTLAWVGRYKFEDSDESGAIGTGDRQIIGNPHPDFTGGLNISAGYKNWDLSSYLYFSVGNDIYKMYMYYTHFGALQSNYSSDRRENSWSPTNTDGIYPMWVGAASESSETQETSNSNYIEDGSYLRMQNLSLGYTIPKNLQSKLGVTSLRVYGQISNLFTLTNYSGLDPEISSGSSSSTTVDRNMGIDYGAYGMPRQFIFGVNVTF